MGKVNLLKLFTMGFTKHSAETFFTKLKDAGVRQVVDTRLNVTSQLSGFTKKDDLSFFLKELNHAGYQHQLLFAPTPALLKEFRDKGDWDNYARKFLLLMKKRKIENLYSPRGLSGSCLLCSEFLPHYCHRRLVAEYLAQKWKNVRIIHL